MMLTLSHPLARQDWHTKLRRNFSQSFFLQHHHETTQVEGKSIPQTAPALFSHMIITNISVNPLNPSGLDDSNICIHTMIHTLTHLFNAQFISRSHS
jgi:hypothetical protein